MGGSKPQPGITLTRKPCKPIRPSCFCAWWLVYLVAYSLLSLFSSYSSQRPRSRILHFLSISPTNPTSKWKEKTKGKNWDNVPGDMISHKVLSCFFLFCYSHQMLIIFQVIVPNLRCQEEKKEPYPCLSLPKRKKLELEAAAHVTSWHFTSCKPVQWFVQVTWR